MNYYVRRRKKRIALFWMVAIIVVGVLFSLIFNPTAGMVAALCTAAPLLLRK